MLQSDAALRSLRSLLRTHLEERSLSKLCEIEPQSWTVESTLASELFESRALLIEGIEVARRELVEALVDQTLRYVHARNQFLPIDSAQELQLAALLERWVNDTRESLVQADSNLALQSSLGAALGAFRSSIGAWLLRLDPAGARKGEELREVRCSEYAPAVQLRVLGIHPDTLPEPILDLGCGQSAALVRHLRQEGKEAFGIDRYAPLSDLVIGKDWLQTPLKPGQWGTIISHLAFSNHFLHQHLRPGGLAEKYALKYLEILKALRPKGRFIYSPGLPFMETLLPKQSYELMKLPVPRVAGSVCDDEMRSVFGTSVCYACHIHRRSG